MSTDHPAIHAGAGCSLQAFGLLISYAERVQEREARRLLSGSVPVPEGLEQGFRDGVTGSRTTNCNCLTGQYAGDRLGGRLHRLGPIGA